MIHIQWLLQPVTGPKQLSQHALQPPSLYRCLNTPLQQAFMTSVLVHSPHPPSCLSWLMSKPTQTGRPSTTKTGVLSSPHLDNNNNKNNHHLRRLRMQWHIHGSNIFIEFTGDTTSFGLINNNDNQYTVRRSSTWQRGALTTTVLSWPRRAPCALQRWQTHFHLYQQDRGWVCVASFKCQDVHISKEYSWTLNTLTLVKKANQLSFFLRRLKKTTVDTDCSELLSLHH